MSETRKTGDKDMSVRGATDSETPSAENAMDLDTIHIEKIREIILGRQVSDYEKRFMKLENRTNDQIDRLRLETDAKLKAMKKDFQDHHAALIRRLQREKDESSCSIAHCLRQLKACFTNRNKKSSR